MSRASDKEFSIKANDWLTVAHYRGISKLTPFLTPQEVQQLSALAKNFDGLALDFEGGFLGAERCRCLIMPIFETSSREDFSIAGFTIGYPKKFSEIGHRQILGSLMGLQIDRSRIGDIVVDASGDAYFAATAEMAPYLMEHFTSVGSVPIKLKPVDLFSIQHEKKTEDFEIMVASLRLDVIVASLLKCSRSDASDCLKEGRVQVNHKQELNHSRMCSPGDLLSIRGYGRCRILEEVRLTKHKKTVLLMGKSV
ncbi:MAG: YlmH/Sll1252 family protein [Turicibacter sp.]|nr:YlmH/Sll1252 family protein [Turicibacter sp.]